MFDFEDCEKRVPKVEPVKKEVKVKAEPRCEGNSSPADDAKHLGSCKLPGCRRCVCVYPKSWASLKAAAQLAAGIDPQIFKSHVQKQTASMTWLTSSTGADGCWGLGCVACAKAGVGSDWALCQAGRAGGKPLWCVKRHARCKSHIKAVSMMIGISPGSMQGAPSIDEFAQVLQHFRKGGSVRSFLEGQSSDRVAMLRWCVFESMAELDRQFLRTASTMSICRDARRARLMVRFGAASSKLDVRTGMLGCRKNGGETSVEIVKATADIFKVFCTRYFAPPRCYLGPPPEVDQELLNHVTSIVEMLNTDAASNELLAGDIGRGRRAGRADLVITPNLKIVGRDQAHSFRRTHENSNKHINMVKY